MKIIIIIINRIVYTTACWDHSIRKFIIKIEKRMQVWWFILFFKYSPIGNLRKKFKDAKSFINESVNLNSLVRIGNEPERTIYNLHALIISLGLFLMLYIICELREIPTINLILSKFYIPKNYLIYIFIAGFVLIYFTSFYKNKYKHYFRLFTKETSTKKRWFWNIVTIICINIIILIISLILFAPTGEK